MIGLLRRYLIPDHLQNGVALMFIVVAFALSNLLHHESGLLTVTVMGLVVATSALLPSGTSSSLRRICRSCRWVRCLFCLQLV